MSGTDDRQEPLKRLTIDAAQLMAEHPPVLRDRNKKAVYQVACPDGCVHRGAIEYTRWSQRWQLKQARKGSVTR
jgi:hypothetical protein